MEEDEARLGAGVCGKKRTNQPQRETFAALQTDRHVFHVDSGLGRSTMIDRLPPR